MEDITLAYETPIYIRNLRVQLAKENRNSFIIDGELIIPSHVIDVRNKLIAHHRRMYNAKLDSFETETERRNYKILFLKKLNEDEKKFGFNYL